MGSRGNFVAHTIPFVWTPATTGSTALTAMCGVEGRVWGIEVQGLRWGDSWTPITAGASSCSAGIVTIYSPLGTVVLSTTTIPSANPYSAKPCAHFFGIAASAGTVFVTYNSIVRYSAAGDNKDHATDAGTERVVSAANVAVTRLPRASVVLYVET